MSKEKTQRSIRISEETNNIIKALTDKFGGTQEAFNKLLQCYNLQEMKANLAEYSADIEKFESYTDALDQMYIMSLINQKNATDLAKTYFSDELASKDKIIQDLQSRLDAAKQSEEQAVLLSQQLQKEVDEQNVRIATLQNTIADKDTIIEQQNLQIAKSQQEASAVDKLLEFMNEQIAKSKQETSATDELPFFGANGERI